MATLDQLPAEQRAIVELVVQRGRSYGALAEVLQVPSERVRELARDALVELSPRTAARVDAGWRGQVADYLLGQQGTEEARTTRDYLKRSESARAWALSLLDSLDPLYPNGASPAVPEGGPAAPEATAQPETASITAEDRIRERARKEAAGVEDEDEESAGAEAEEADDEPAAEAKAVAKPTAAQPAAEPKRSPARLSPEAESALRRRRIIGAVAGVALLAAIVVGVLAIAGVFSSDDNGSSSDTTASTTPTTGTSTTPGQQQPIQVQGQIALQPVGGTKAQGIAYVVSQGSQKFLVVQAQVPPLPNNQKVAAYEVWLYNSNGDARSLGAQYTNRQGILQGRAPLPADYQKFKSVDISRELFADKNAGHGTNSVLRGDFSTLKPVPQQPQGTGTSTTPTP
jgi:hypothetical protein